MTSDAIWQLQKAVYVALDGDASLSALVNGVFDFVPEDTEFPYVVIGDAGTRDWSTVTTKGAEITLEIDSYSRERGSKELLEIMTLVQDILHDVNLALTGHTLVNLRHTDSRITRERDGLTSRGTNIFRAVIEES